MSSGSARYIELYDRGIRYLSEARVDEAETVFEIILADDPEFAPAHFGLGCVHAFWGLWDMAAEEWKRSVEIDPSCGQAHYALAWLYYERGDRDEGYEHVSRAVESGVDLDTVKFIFEEIKEGVPPEIGERQEERLFSAEPEERSHEDEGPIEVAAISQVAEKSIMFGIFRNIKSIAVNKKLRLDIIFSLLIAIVCFFLLKGTLREGYPRAFLDGTMAYYIAKINMLLNNFKFYTESWYFGFELLRFYPPLSAIIPYVVAMITGKTLLSYYYLSFIFYVFFCVGNYFFVSRFLDSRSAGLLAGVVWALTHSNVVSFQGHYWETPRLAGTATLPWLLMSLDSSLRSGEKKSILAGVGLVSYTLLTNMFSILDLAIFGIPFLAIRGWYLPLEHRDMKSIIKKRTLKIISLGVLGVLAFSFWWYLPAVLPYGLSGYTMEAGSIPPDLNLALLQFNPPDWTPVTQLPVTVLGLLGAVVFLFKWDRRGAQLLVWLIITVTSAYVIRLQSVRMLSLISLSLVYLSSYFLSEVIGVVPILSKRLTEIGRRDITTILSICIIGFLIIQYLPIYSRYATVNKEYLATDEYRTALWLKEKVNGDFRVYVMYGNNYRGAQWINVFSVETKQVLGGNDIGPYMVDRTPFVFDDVVKSGMDPNELSEISSKYHVKYIVLDDSYMSRQGEAYEKFNGSSFESVDEINELLHYAKVFEVKNIDPLPAANVKYNYWDIWRQLGVIGTAIFTACFIIVYRKLELAY